MENKSLEAWQSVILSAGSAKIMDRNGTWRKWNMCIESPTELTLLERSLSRCRNLKTDDISCPDGRSTCCTVNETFSHDDDDDEDISRSKESSDEDIESDSSPHSESNDYNNSGSSMSSLSSSSIKRRPTLLARKKVIYTDHLIERCWERGIPHHKVEEIVKSDKWKFENVDGRREYHQDGLCLITGKGDGREEEVGITVFRVHCRQCGANEKMCDKGYCYKCCWGCDECNKYKCTSCNAIMPLAKGGKVSLLCKGELCLECCSGCTLCQGDRCNDCDKRGDHRCLGPPCFQCGERGLNNCHKESGVFCKSCCYGCDNCVGPACYQCGERSFQLCDNGRGVQRVINVESVAFNFVTMVVGYIANRAVMAATIVIK
eukprot:scaffold5329_cov126-Skeletonema_marinoi.AAC.5